jgi:hypothetical protein
MTLNIPLQNPEGVLRLPQWMVANPSTNSNPISSGLVLIEEQPTTFVERRPYGDEP